MRFALLRSGSSGNCTIIEHEETRVLLDAGGHSMKRLHGVFDETGIDPSTLTAILISHFHSDHCNTTTLRLCQRYRISLWMHTTNTRYIPTLFAPAYLRDIQFNTFSSGRFDIGELNFFPFPLSHDAPGVTSGFKFWATGCPDDSVSYAADLGYFPDSLVQHFTDVQSIIIESNHDETLLWNNPHRPYFNKKRVAGNWGHLSNDQAGEAVVKILTASKRVPERIILNHLSGDHNTPSLALDNIGTLCNRHAFDIEITCASRTKPVGYFSHT
jgi:phosphoribosyl 1,2-cyclic phosphodiesterase